MKQRKIFYLFGLAASFLLFTGGWVEDRIFEMELKPRIGEPYAPVDQNFAVLQARHNEVLREKEILDALYAGLASSSNGTGAPDGNKAFTAGSGTLLEKIPDLTNDIAVFAIANQTAFEEVLSILNGIQSSPSRGSELLQALRQAENKKQLYETWASATLLSLGILRDDVMRKSRDLDKYKGAGAPPPAKAAAKTGLTSASGPPASITVKPEEIFRGLKTKQLPADPGTSLALYEEALRLMESGQIAEAMKKFRQSLDYDADNYRAMQRMTELYILDGQYDLAIRMINRAIDTYKKNHALP